MSGRGHIIEPKNTVPRSVIILFGLIGVAALAGVLVILAPSWLESLLNDEPANDNRTWLTREWTQSLRPEADFISTIEIMQDNGIQGVYVQTHTWHGQTGDLIELPYSRQFLERFRNHTETVTVYAWIIVEPERLLSIPSRQAIVEAMRVMTLEYGYSGVHIQARSIQSDNEEFVTLLRAIRGEIGQTVPVSITVPPDRPPVDPDVPTNINNANPELTWSQGYKRRIALLVDEMVLMAHASALTDSTDYEKWIAYQTSTYTDMIQSLDISMSFIVALPTYEAELGHDPEVENVNSAVAGILMSQSENSSVERQLDGVGLYPWEQTDLFELDAYWNEWVNR